MSVDVLRTMAASLARACVLVVPLLASGCAADRASHPQIAFAGTSQPSPPSVPVKMYEVSNDTLAYAGDPSQTPAYRYAQLDRAACEAELTQRAIPWVRVDEARGVLAPVRLTGPVRGVLYHSGIPVNQRATSPLEIFDCRLVLALDDFSNLLARHDIVEVVHMSAYRPPSRKRWPAGKVGRQHEGALALDAGTFVRRDGTTLSVEKDFHGHIGAKTCGPGTGPWPATAEAVALRRIVCDATDAHLFTVALTPDFNWPHRNHFHLEVTANVTWFLVH